MSAKNVFLACAAPALVMLEEEEQENKCRYWVHLVIANREQLGQFWAMYGDLRVHEEKLFEYTPVSVKSFDEFLELLSAHLFSEQYSAGGKAHHHTEVLDNHWPVCTFLSWLENLQRYIHT
ncbi:hypothetical protein AB205_0145360 [Aquarana catesbeiana]|uniref:Uncharacterized protein n=1 Tax=Aquarana catesbeiana TaxID=8400 RepID=A0A2G9QJT6_AQUCT|nr:hypothetical protein AB205_0145360 [Aquarana catesbeiana]